jgi:hypothetical protein
MARIYRADLTGQQFGRLTVLSEAPRQNKQRYWLCRCQCGNEITTRHKTLQNGCTRSCGCLRKEVTVNRFLTHGHTAGRYRGGQQSRTYSLWCAMLRRCRNLQDTHYAYYGGRGITVCERWLVFENFLADMGEAPEGLQLDRIDNGRGYEPENCQWADRIAQSNNKRNNRLLTHNGITDTLANWARRLGMNSRSLCNRLHLGWSVERALTEPVNR